MKIAVMNFSGNVGKTTISSHLLKPRMPKAQIYSIESINAGADESGLDVETMRGKKFGALIDEIMMLDEAIIDVGASNVEDFVKMMQQYSGSHEEIDLFVIPTVKEKKVQVDTSNTIKALNKMGIPAEKIHVVFNKMDTEEVPEDEFEGIFALSLGHKLCTASNLAIIYSNEVFEKLKSKNLSLGSLLEDKTDYRQKLRESKDQSEKEMCVQMIGLKRLSITANENLDQVFKTITK